MGVKPASKLQVHNYDLEQTSVIKFTQTTDLYMPMVLFRTLELPRILNGGE